MGGKFWGALTTDIGVFTKGWDSGKFKHSDATFHRGTSMLLSLRMQHRTDLQDSGKRP